MSDTREVTSAERRGRLARGMKVAILTLGILALLVLALMFAGVGGEHGPSRHTPPEQNPQPSSDHTPPGSHG